MQRACFANRSRIDFSAASVDRKPDCRIETTIGNHDRTRRRAPKPKSVNDTIIRMGDGSAVRAVHRAVSDGHVHATVG
ncbi:hypothetical protein NX905_27295 [Burkholderia thailandensis]|uniref:hypothetical protein n=1 Tax=Burkholderia thailandensis TaxID=57975 RepID=UPI00217ED14E|nr:hypothetical protein [Burkholderia thailandensis]MCS6497934.1 hypothetical protein [Burkholderia thailandensis]